MTYIRVEHGEPHYCEVILNQPSFIEDGEEVETPPLTLRGIFSVSDEEIKLELYKFDTFFHVDDGEYLIARTSQSWFAALTSYVSTGSGFHGRDHSAQYQTFTVNTVIIGWTPWLRDSLVKRTRFLVPGADILLRHSVIYRNITNSHIGSNPASELIDCPVEGGRIRIFYSWTANLLSNYPREVWPVIEMEFTDDLPEDKVRDKVVCLLRFLSAANSVRFIEAEQTISKIDHSQWLANALAGKREIAWSVYHWTSAQERAPLSPHGGAHGAFAINHNDKERLFFADCLSEWFRRNREWEPAYSAMMEAFSLQTVMSAERLLNVTRWLEATPGTQPAKLFSDNDRGALAKLVARGADQLGYDAQLRGRVKGAIGGIKEDRNKVWSRLVGEIKAVFGVHIVGDDLAAWVSKAFSLRGNAAHRPIIGLTEVEYEVFSKAVYAAECFAFLMLLKDLPITPEGKERVAQATMVRYYRLEIKGSLPPK